MADAVFQNSLFLRSLPYKPLIKSKMKKQDQKLIRYFIGVLVLLSASMTNAQTWNELTNPTVGAEEVSRMSSIEGHVTGVYLCTNLGVFRSTNNGASFTNLTYQSGVTANLPINCLFIDDNDDAIYIGGETTVFKSTDNGSSWSVTALTTANSVNDINESNGNIVVVEGGFFGGANTGGAYYSTDGLATVQAATGLPDDEMLDAIYFDNKLFIAGSDGMYSSTDDGVNWALQGTGHPINGRYIKTVDLNGNLFSGDINGKGLYKSSDNGNTWASTDPNTFMEFCQVFDLESGSGIVLALTDGVNCNPQNIPIRYSADNGVSWQSGMGNLPLAFYNELGRNAEGTCFFTYALFERKLYTTCDLLAVTENTLDNFIVSPNPTSGNFSISGYTSANVFIYNTQGIVIKKLTNVPANKIIDISEVASGIYFVKVQNDTASKTIKLLKK
ncbi:MAG: photosystem II stability/assembly factor-like uncharacterized protein [Cyclobacteriaceae bacterium]|jgi:photosystem II stability/assembly factor-like uncharacterized protein